MKYSIVTFGCRVNQADSLVIEEELRARGATSTHPHEADLIVVNTCSVTASADQGARQTIRRIVRDNPSARVVVTGCYATRRPDEVAALARVVRVVHNDLKDTLVSDLDEDGELTTAERYGDGEGSCGASLEPGAAGRTALTLRVQTGCEERCSYCIIPGTRGRSRSRTVSEVLEAVRRATASGYKEIVITGVHLGSFGRDLPEATTLTALVRHLAQWPDDVLFRISSLEPMDCTDEIVQLVAASPRLAPHFHLPLQHGSDVILEAMKRSYTSNSYRRLVERIRDRMPEASIGTDLIVGFPGELRNHFMETADFVERLPLSHFHVFPYSDRPGTVASRLTARVDGKDIRERANKLRAIGERLTRVFQASQVGTVRRALTVDDGSRAVTDNYLKVRIPRERSRNEWVHLVIGGVPGALEGSFANARSL
jgi:threonylcarbamoyladenosine tRNA methylthiotransferase MtaB